MEGGAGRVDALKAIGHRLIDVDGERAAAIFKEAADLEGVVIDEFFLRSSMGDDLGRAVKLLANKDPAAAMAWVAKHYPESSPGMVSQLLPRDGVAAVQALAALPDSALSDGKSTNWPMDDWNPSNLEGALERVSTLPESGQRNLIHAWLLNAMASNDPKTAVHLAASELSDPTSRQHIFGRGMKNWAKEDLSGAAEWLTTREPGPETDAAIGGFLMVAKYLEPEAAFDLANAVSSPEVRIKQLEAVYTTLVDSSGEAVARDFLHKASLSDAEMKIVMDSGTKGKSQ